MTTRPLVVAHRVNDAVALEGALAAGADAVEVDVNLAGGRLELRHGRRLGALPLVWDERRLRPLRRPVCHLEELLGRTPAEVPVVLDLKGGGARVAERLAAALREAGAGSERTWICARDWRQLEPLASGEAGARLLHSAGSAQELRALEQLAARGAISGASVDWRLLDDAAAARLRERLQLLMLWTVNDAGAARGLARWGPDAIVTDEVAALRAALAR